MTCSNCGTEMADDHSFCEHCGSAVDEQDFIVLAAGSGPDGGGVETAPVRQQPPPPPPPLGSVPFQRAAAVSAMPGYARPTFGAPGAGQPQFHLAQDERVLKTYEVVQLRPGLLRRKRGQGTLYVTDARVVFYAWVYKRGTQRESWVFQQTKLEDISGLSAYVTRRISLGLLVLSLAFGFAALATLVTLVRCPLFVLFAILAALCIGLLIWDASTPGDRRRDHPLAR